MNLEVRCPVNIRRREIRSIWFFIQSLDKVRLHL